MEKPSEQQISKYLFKVIEPDGKWHEALMKDKPQTYACNCGMRHCNKTNPDYFTKEGFWDIWEWAIKQEWWADFLYCYAIDWEGEKEEDFMLDLINYKQFARHVFEYLGGWGNERD